MKNYFLSAVILSFSIVFSMSLISGVFAQSSDDSFADLNYPIEELGNCSDKDDCKFFCDKAENLSACVNFAEKNNLMNQEEIQTAKKFEEIGGKGPGGCTGKNSCEKYCNDISKIDECVAFAEKNNLMSSGELAEAKKVKAAIDRGVKPPACGNKEACDSYCGSPEHMEECVAFAEAAGFMSDKEIQESKQFLAAIKRGVKPLPCQGKESCDAYCTKPDNTQRCMEFAIEAGFMSESEKQDAEKFLSAVKKGVKAPNCKGKEKCDAYCGEEEHFEECMNFAVAAGFMSEKDAEMAKKTGGKGPGGCVGKEQCEAFCNNPDNQETCFSFAKENGMIPEGDLRQMEDGKQKFQESLNQMPPEVSACLDSSVGSEIMEKFRSGTSMPSQDLGDKMRQCFELNMPKPQDFQEKFQNQEGQQILGPNQQQMIGPGPEGQQNQQIIGPGAPCSSEEECKKLFESQGFQPQIMEKQKFELKEGEQGGFIPSQGVEQFSPSMEGAGQQQKFMQEQMKQFINPPQVEGQFNQFPQPQEGQTFQQPPQNFGGGEQFVPGPVLSPEPAPAPAPESVPIQEPIPSPSSSIKPTSLFGLILNFFVPFTDK